MPKRDAVTREEIAALRDQGLPSRDIALRLGIGYKNLQRLVAKYGLTEMPEVRAARKTRASPEQIVATIERGREVRARVHGKTYPPIPKTAAELQAYVSRGLTFTAIRNELEMGEATLAKLAAVLGVEIPRSGMERLAQVAVNLQTPMVADPPSPGPPSKSFAEALGMSPEIAPPRTLAEIRAEAERRKQAPPPSERLAQPAAPPSPPKRETLLTFPAPPAKARPASAPVYLVIDRAAAGAEMAGLLYGASQIAAGLGAAVCYVKLDLREGGTAGQDTGKSVAATEEARQP